MTAFGSDLKGIHYAMEFLTSNIRAMAKHQCAWPTGRPWPSSVPTRVPHCPPRVTRPPQRSEYPRVPPAIAQVRYAGHERLHLCEGLRRSPPPCCARHTVSAWRRVPFQSGPMGGFAAAVCCPQGKDVLVIGGGDTGCDCIGASSRACALLRRSTCLQRSARQHNLSVRRSSAQHGPCRKAAVIGPSLRVGV